MTGQHPGGLVTGPGGEDSIPVPLMPGEHLYDKDGRRVFPLPGHWRKIGTFTRLETSVGTFGPGDILLADEDRGEAPGG